MTILAKSLSSSRVHRKAFGANINYAMIMYKEHVQIVTFWFGGISNWFGGKIGLCLPMLESLFNSLLKPRSPYSNFYRMSNKGMGYVNYGGPTIIVQLHTSYTLKQISHYCKRSIDPVFYNLRPSFFIFSNFHFFTLMNLLSPPPYMSYVSHTNELH